MVLYYNYYNREASMNNEQYTLKANQAIQDSVKLGVDLGNQEITPLHLAAKHSRPFRKISSAKPLKKSAWIFQRSWPT